MHSPHLSDASTPAESEHNFVDTPATTNSDLLENLDELLLRFPVESSYILVTGGLGFIGSHTTLELLKANYNAIVIDNLSNAFENVFERISTLAQKYHTEKGTQMPDLRLHAHDYRDTAALRPLLEEHQIQTRWNE